ncbi:MAG TPA: hypothetical protein VFP80_12445 [Thermoanaerobaculia bacterium]|nr:hypothetical protein [Thermoanaerobaculia bacterium]
MNELTVNVLGFAAVNTDLKAQLRDTVTGAVLEERPLFRDGTARFPKVRPGQYDLHVVHPNMPLRPVVSRPIRMLPVGPTKISILIDPKDFQNTALEDVPDVDLTPLAKTMDDVELAAQGLGNKKGGEAILASDWNAMASSVALLAKSVSELTRLVTPVGHNHPEYEKKINEMSSNFDKLVGTLSASMAEIQRQLQIRRLEEVTTKLLDEANVPLTNRKVVEERFDRLREKVTESPRDFSELMRNQSADIERAVKDMVGTAGDDKTKNDFNLTFENAARFAPKDHAAEIEFNNRTNRALGAQNFTKRSIA